MIRIVTGLRALETQKRRPHISAIAEPRRWTSASWRVERRQRGHKTVLQTSGTQARSEEHTSELQSLMRISYAVFCLKKKKKQSHNNINTQSHNYCISYT